MNRPLRLLPGRGGLAGAVGEAGVVKSVPTSDSGSAREEVAGLPLTGVSEAPCAASGTREYGGVEFAAS